MTRRVVLGDVFLALRSAAIQGWAELLVVGEHRRSPLRDAFRDTTVERLIRVSPCPVLLSRLPAGGPYRHALVGIESDEASELLPAIDAMGAAKPEHTTVLHAFEAVGSGLLLYAGSIREQVASYENEVAVSIRNRFASQLGRVSDQPLEIRVVNGEPVWALETAARENDCDLVVVSTHARRGLARSILGSVSSTLIRHGSTDVLVVPRSRRQE